MESNEVNFRPVDASDFKLIQLWFNTSHVQAFYSLRSWTLDEIEEKLTPYLQGEVSMDCYLICLGPQPIGYIQVYPVKDHPWEGQDLPEEVIQNGAGLDLLIGEEDFLNRGLGRVVLNLFLTEYVWPKYTYCVVDPDLRNVQSMRLFTTCGFIAHKQIRSNDSLGRGVTLQLLMRQKED